MIVDAPSSGHGLAMLTTPRTFGEIARVGPIRRQAFKIRDTLADPERTGYVAVALPEEMPVNETLELERQLPEAVGSRLEAIVVNGLWPERFSAADAEALRASADGVPAVRAALTSYERARGQRSHLRRLRRAADAQGRDAPLPVRRRARAAGVREARGDAGAQAVTELPSRRLAGNARWVWRLRQALFWGIATIAVLIIAAEARPPGLARADPARGARRRRHGGAGAALARAGAGTCGRRRSRSAAACW